jgi:catechol 2,3-dioxygenase-like lactoylglutathione lyase family enzyme
MSTRLALVTILVQDMSRAKAFYTDLLGFEVMQDFSSPAGEQRRTLSSQIMAEL